MSRTEITRIEDIEMQDKQKGKRCKGKTKEGKSCGAAATVTGLCFFHSNPNRASELGRKGGRSKPSRIAEEGAPLPSLDTMKSVHDMSKRLFEEAYLGKRQRNDTAGLVRLLELITESIRFTNLEERLARLEQGRAQSDEGAPNAPDGANGSKEGSVQ